MTTCTLQIHHEYERHLQVFWGCSEPGRDVLAIEMVFQVLVRYMGRL